MKWTDDDVATLRRMYIEGKSRIDIALDLDRSPASVKSRLQLEPWTPEEMDLRAQASRERRRKPEAGNRVQLERLSSDPRPAMDTIAERDYRAGLMPRDLTAAICGDPLPGYSALERRWS